VGDIQITATMKRATGMAQPLTARGHQVGIIAWDTPANRARLQKECPNAEPIWLPRGLHGFQESRMKIARMRAWRPDVVYVCAFSSHNWIMRISLPDHCRVIIEHSERFSAIPGTRKRHLWELLLEYVSVLGADGLLCASRYLTNLYARHARAMGRSHLPVHYFPYAYGSEAPPDPARVTTLRQQTTGKKTVLYMGTLMPNYGIFDILHATANLLRKRQDFRLVVLGHGDAARQARTLVERLGLGGVVEFYGYVPDKDLPMWFLLADVFLAPLNNTVQDLARCPSKVYMYLPFRKPIVTCPIGDPHDLLGEDGFYYPAGDVNGMSQAMERALDASTTWKPAHVDPQKHNWSYRTDEFLAWLDTIGIKSISSPAGKQ
jgi:glycosyltransferase involved in cell wall biosynthesis